MWRAWVQNLLHPLQHVTHLHYWFHKIDWNFVFANCHSFGGTSFFLQKSVYGNVCLYCGLISFDIFHNLYEVIEVGLSDMQRFFNQTRLYSFVFLHVWKYFMTGQESSSYNCRIWSCWYLVFQISIVSTFLICSEFCAENWLLCCDLNCKWVICRSNRKRFWKRALHIQAWKILIKKMSKLPNSLPVNIWFWGIFCILDRK